MWNILGILPQHYLQTTLTPQLSRIQPPYPAISLQINASKSQESGEKCALPMVLPRPLAAAITQDMASQHTPRPGICLWDSRVLHSNKFTHFPAETNKSSQLNAL